MFSSIYFFHLRTLVPLDIIPSNKQSLPLVLRITSLTISRQCSQERAGNKRTHCLQVCIYMRALGPIFIYMGALGPSFTPSFKNIEWNVTKNKYSLCLYFQVSFVWRWNIGYKYASFSAFLFLLTPQYTAYIVQSIPTSNL